MTEEVFKSWRKLSSRRKRRILSCSSRRRTISTRSSTSSWTVIEAKLGSSWSSWEKPQWNGRIEAISRLNIRHNCEEKIGRRSRYHPWTHWRDTGITKWNQLHERFERFSRCWISTQWTFPRYQSTCVFPTSSSSWWNAKPFSGNAEPQKWAAKHLGHTWYIGNVFANPAASSSAPYPQELNPWSSYISEHTSPHVMSENQTPVQDQRCQSGPSARNSVIPSEGDFSKNYGADQQRLQISDLHFDKFTHTSNVCLLEDKIQDWGVYLFTISYGSYAVDQRSGVGWFSGWSKIFMFCKRNSNARFWSTRCEDCFSTEQNHP